MRWACCAVATLALAACGSATQGDRHELLIFHAGSLAVPLKKAAAEFEAIRPDVDVELESSGSLVGARKISDLGRTCDLFASADTDAITNLLMPDHASWYLVFASNEMVLAYRPGLPEALVPTQDNWTKLLLDPERKYGRSDPNGDPAGYRALLAIKLAEDVLSKPGLHDALTGKDERFVRPKSADLIALLQAGAIDYAFVYRSVAIQHQAPYLELPPEIHLGAPAHAPRYATARVQIAGERPGETMTVQGQPILYALTIPRNARDDALAIDFLHYFLSADGGLAVLERNHQKTLVPAATPHFDDLPEPLKPFARPTSP